MKYISLFYYLKFLDLQRFFGDLYYCTGWSMMNGKKWVSGSHSPQNPNLGTDDCLTGL